MITKGYVSTTDGQIHFRHCQGGRGVPLVMFHMTGSSSLAFEPMMTELDGRFPLIAIDTMNYGESFRTTRPASINYIANTMLEALGNLGIETFHALGHHTGSSIAAEMAVIAPERVVSALLNGPMYATSEELAYFMKLWAMPNPITIKGTQVIWAWSRIKDNFSSSIWVETPNAAAILNREVVDMLRAGENWHWGYQAVFSYDISAAMERIKCPMLFPIGRLDGALPFHERAAKAFPHAATSVHDEGGVYYFESHPAHAAARVAEFIDGLKG